MPIMIKTRDQRGEQRLLLCRDRISAEILVNALTDFQFPIETEWVVVHRDPVTCREFVVTNGKQYYLHPRSWGAKLEPNPPEEVSEDAVV